MRIVFRGSLTPLAIVAVVALSLPLPLLAVPGLTWAASAGTQVVVSQEAVTAKPYDLVLAPDGEFRILHFNAGLVGLGACREAVVAHGADPGERRRAASQGHERRDATGRLRRRYRYAVAGRDRSARTRPDAHRCGGARGGGNGHTAIVVLAIPSRQLRRRVPRTRGSQRSCRP